VEVELPIQRVFCEECGDLRQVKIGFADPRRMYTRSFERFVLELSHCMTIQDVAQHVKIGWDTVKEIQKRNLERHYARPKLKHLQQLAIDEISVGKGHRYVTVVLDWKSGAVVFVGKGKGAEALEPFWRRLRSSRARIQAVAMDMSPAYIEAVSRNLPKAAIVFDHFHVIQLFNRKLSDFRRELYSQTKDTTVRAVLKGIRWLLLKNPENLVPEKNERERLEEALRLNQPLALVYYLKEALREFWNLDSRTQAEAYLNDWIAQAKASGIRMVYGFAKTLERHRDGLIAYYLFPLSTGPLEGTNNKIKTLKRQAYGFRDLEFFTLKIMSIHESKYALVG
jgi:transposase